jgi:transposase
MRGDDQQLQTGMFSYVSLEDRIPADHPLRGVRKLVDAVLAEMSKDFDGLYSQVGRPSIAPERLLRALLLQVFYSVRSERLLMEQLNYNLLFRWFVGLEIDDAVWNRRTCRVGHPFLAFQLLRAGRTNASAPTRANYTKP